jgi:hypothetical protein
VFEPEQAPGYLHFGKNLFSMASNVPAVYEICRIARFTCIQNILSGVISLPYNELALLVQRIYATTDLRHCGCDCDIRRKTTHPLALPPCGINNLALKLPREPVSGFLGIKPHRYE